MNSRSYTWIKVADSLAELTFSPGGMATVRAGEKEVCLSNYKGRLSACAATCPHAGAPLAEGYIDALGNMVCALHHYRFSLANGRNVSGEGYHLKTWPVETREDGIYIGMTP